MHGFPEADGHAGLHVGDDHDKGIGANLTNDEKRAHLIDLKREHLMEQVRVQEIGPTSFNLIAVWACHHRCFISDAWTNSILNVTVGHFDDWVGRGLSDHVPLVVDIDEMKSEITNVDYNRDVLHVAEVRFGESARWYKQTILFNKARPKQ